MKKFLVVSIVVIFSMITAPMTFAQSDSIPSGDIKTWAAHQKEMKEFRSQIWELIMKPNLTETEKGKLLELQNKFSIQCDGDGFADKKKSGFERRRFEKRQFRGMNHGNECSSCRCQPIVIVCSSCCQKSGADFRCCQCDCGGCRKVTSCKREENHPHPRRIMKREGDRFKSDSENPDRK